jgi:uncharacterized protein YodC (DUF2158 family)
MSNASFKPGDTVRLKSGGPVMTVTAVDGDTILCDWFDGTKKSEAKFLAAALASDDSFATQQPRW